MTDIKVTVADIIKSVLVNERAWMFVLVIIVICGGIWQSEMHRRDRAIHEAMLQEINITLHKIINELDNK